MVPVYQVSEHVPSLYQGRRLALPHLYRRLRLGACQRAPLQWLRHLSSDQLDP